MTDRTGLILLDRVEGGEIALITLNRPEKLNALSHAMSEELDGIIKEVDEDPTVRCIIFTGAGDRAFSAGFDLNEMSGWSRDEWLRMMYRIEPWVFRWATVSKPTIAAVNGVAHGAGAILASNCDFRFGCERSSFRFTAASGGAVNNTWFLPHIVGMTKAKDFIYSAEAKSAEYCNDAGMFSEFVAPDEVLPASIEYAKRICVHPAAGLLHSKRLLRESIGRTFHDAYTAENATMGWVLSLPDPADNPHVQEWGEHKGE